MGGGKLLFAVALVAPLVCAQSSGSISGRVTNSITGAGIEGVKVRAACLPGGSSRCPNADASAVTDTAGAFHLSALPDALYQMSVEKDGFTRFENGVINVARVTASGEARFDLKLTPLARLSGRVVDQEGNPLAGIAVQLGGSTATTDEQGAFLFQKLNPASYQLAARAAISLMPQRGQTDGEKPVTTYFPSAIYPEQAVPIEVNGVDLSGYEIRLRTAPARTVRGVLLDADGKPMPHVPVSLGKANPPTGLIPMVGEGIPTQRFLPASSMWDRCETGANGAFEFPAVLEGDWILKGYDFSSRQGGAVEVQVGRSEAGEITLRLARPFPIEISQDPGDSSELTDPRPPLGSVSVVPLDGQVAASTGRDAETPFTQHEEGLPGRYLFAPQPATPGYYVSAAMLDGRDVMWQAVELSGPASVKLVLKKDGGTLRGVVENGGGTTVVLMADATAYARFGLTGVCDAEGKFSIADVPPGNYTAIAFRDHQVLYQRDLLTRIDSANGERVKIEGGGSETISLKAN